MSWAAVAGAAVSVVGGMAADKANAPSSGKKRAKINEQFIRDMQQQSRDDLFGGFGNAQHNANLGFQSGLDVMGQYMPQVFDTFHQGNMGAQNQLIAGMPQVHNAILGMPIDYSAFQPVSVNYDTGFTQQTLPDFRQVGDWANQEQQQPIGSSGFYDNPYYRNP